MDSLIDQQIKSLFEAYVESTGMRVSLNFPRRQDCRALVKQGVTPDDVRAVIAELQRRISRRLANYSAASLEWGNSMRPAKFEERLALLKKIEKSREARLTAVAAKAREVAGSTFTVTDEAKAREIREKAKQAAEELKKRLFGS